MRVHLIVQEQRGHFSIQTACTAGEIDASPDDWLACIESAREEAADPDPRTAERFGVIVLDIPEDQIQAAFQRGALTSKALTIREPQA